MASAQDVWAKFGSRFPESYKTTPPEIAMRDIGLDGYRSKASRCASRSSCSVMAPRRTCRCASCRPGAAAQRRRAGAASHGAARDEPPRGAAAGSGPHIYITGFEILGNDGKRIEDPTLLDRLSTIIQRVLLGQLHDDCLLGLEAISPSSTWKQIRSADHRSQRHGAVCSRASARRASTGAAQASAVRVARRRISRPSLDERPETAAERARKQQFLPQIARV